jgi:hypothetical protein
MDLSPKRREGSALEDLFFLGSGDLVDLFGIIVDNFLEKLQAVELVVLGDLLVLLELLDLLLALPAPLIIEGRDRDLDRLPVVQRVETQVGGGPAGPNLDELSRPVIPSSPRHQREHAPAQVFTRVSGVALGVRG